MCICKIAKKGKKNVDFYTIFFEINKQEKIFLQTF
jgi:hypothetical protein